MRVSKIECAIIRGGTTKGIYIDSRQLPTEAGERDRLILSLFGSPDTRQINGLGGADPLTSKVALISPSAVPEADIDYTSGEVGIDQAIINYSTMCGNLASGAALFAIEFGLVPRVEPVTEVRIHNTNTGKRITALVPVVSQACVLSNSASVDGVRGKGCELRLRFHDPAGSITGELLPTSRVVNEVRLSEGGIVPVSIVDCGTLYGFVSAKGVGIVGSESPRQLDNDDRFKGLIEDVREGVAEAVSAARQKRYSSRQVKIAVVSPALPDARESGADQADIAARVINSYKTHKAYPVTGAICLSAASAIKGTLVHQIIGDTAGLCTVRIAHPTGVIKVSSSFTCEGDVCHITETEVSRSARLLMSGVGYAC